MLASVPITPGVGAAVATDFVGGLHYQISKIAFGGLDVVTPVSPDAPLPVGGRGRVLDVTLSLDTNTYATGDVLAETQAVTGALRVDGTGWLNSVLVIDEDDQRQAFDLLFFSSNASLGTENAAPAITDEGARALLGLVKVQPGDFTDLGGVSIANVYPGLGLKAATGTDTIYVAAISRGAGTYTASGVRLRLHVLAD